MATHVKVLAVLFIVFGACGVILAIFAPMLMGMLATIVGSSDEAGAPIGAMVLGFTGIALSIVLFVFSAPSIVCGIGLLKVRPWARILGIVLAAIGLIRFPFGTIFGVYALWVFFSKDTEVMFAR